MLPDQLYLDLMKKCLTRLIFTETYAPLKEPRFPFGVGCGTELARCSNRSGSSS